MTQLISQIHKGVGATIQGVGQVIKDLEKASLNTQKNLNSAIRGEGFRLKNLLQKQIRSGSPGGATFKPLSFIARRLNSTIQTMGGRTAKQSPNRKPLNRLAIGIRYEANDNPAVVAVGWVGPQTRFDARMASRSDMFGRGILEKDVTSKSWRRLGYFHQKGFTRTITEAQRRYIIYRGSRLGKVEGGSTPFFLKKSTRTFTTPARQIINPFWDQEKKAALSNIKRNFEIKQRGGRFK